MAGKSSKGKGRVWSYMLALVVFPAISVLAAKFIFGRVKESGTAMKIRSKCPEDLDVFSSNFDVEALGFPYRLSYTSYPGVDKALCGFVTFFHGLMEPSPESFAFLTVGLPAMGTVAALLYIEATRQGASWLVRFPTAYSLVYQVFTIGVITPIYLLAFVLSGHARNGGQINRANAKAVAFGVFFGALVPTNVMFYFQKPGLTALWQIFPVYIFLLQKLYLILRPRSVTDSKSGYNIIQASYGLLFALCATTHLYIFSPTGFSLNSLQATYLPSIPVLDPQTTSFAQGTIDFLKFDALFSVGATIVASLWFARSALELAGVVMWYAVATPLVGPGAALLAVWMWRESRLNTGKRVKNE